MTNVKNLFNRKIKEACESIDEDPTTIGTIISAFEVAETKFKNIQDLNAEIELLIDDAEPEEFSETAMNQEIDLKTEISHVQKFTSQKTTPPSTIKIDTDTGFSSTKSHHVFLF